MPSLKPTKRTAPSKSSRPGTTRSLLFGKHRKQTVKSIIIKPTKVKFAKNCQPSNRIYQKKLALLLPGHNEELIIASAIRSAIAAGQSKRDIYVVDDCSSDNTRKEALKVLDKDHVLTVRRSGKALAVQKGIKRFKIKQNYTWLHIADADSLFSPNYFRIYRKKLDPKKYAVAVGFVQSMRGNWISTYRALTYTYSQHVNRRIQSYFGMVSVFPGPITCFRTDILNKLNFHTNSMTEDFDITLQVHRKKLGRIKYIPKAVNYTQDPQTLRDFYAQNLRWQRGFFQGVKKYRIGTKPRMIDLSIGYQMGQTIVYLLEIFVLSPVIIARTHNFWIIPMILTFDFIVAGITAMFATVAAKRWSLMGALPYFYFLRWLEISAFIQAFFEIIVLRKFRHTKSGWETKGRRYKLTLAALRDTVK